MTYSISVNDNQACYKNRLYKISDRIGIETTCFILDLWDVELKKLYDKLRNLLQLEKKYQPTAIEASCERANFYNQLSPAMLKLILKYFLFELPLDADTNLWGHKTNPNRKNFLLP